jgi:hypothetical protein
MKRTFNTMVVGVLLLVGLSGCASLTEAYDSASNSVSDFFKSDKKEEKK